jgi:quercetin dioxygenase-like cupin family protein
LEYQVGNKAYRLEAGDTLLFSAHLKHRWRNPGNTVTNAIFVLFGCEEAELHVGGHFTSDQEIEMTVLKNSESDDE